MEVTGRIIQIRDIESGIAKSSGNAWNKRDIVIETEEQYSKKICITFMGDKAVNIGNVAQVGMRITVGINIESREYNDRWYTSVNGWKYDFGANDGTAQYAQTPTYQPPAPVATPAGVPAHAPASQPAQTTMQPNDEFDDLPF